MSMKGTLYWMAPEMMQGKDVGRPADIWSLGCLVVEMFTAQAPWHDQLDKKLKNNMVRMHISGAALTYLVSSCDLKRFYRLFSQDRVLLALFSDATVV